MEVNRRTQAERTAATRSALIAAARSLFAEHGFSGVGTQAIVAKAGVTRGALYHQFADKDELFVAVFEEVEAEVMAKVAEAVGGAVVADPLEAMEVGAREWLTLCADPDVHRIVLLEAPVVLGWEAWREAGQRYALGLIETLIEQAVASGAAPEQPVRPLAHAMIGALDEAAMYVARSEEPEKARAEMFDVARRLIRAITIE
jgi:AcrR family transcriptional regulator